MAKRVANTQISKDSMSDGQGLWGEGAQTSGPQQASAADLATRRMAKPRTRRPLPGHRLPPPRSNLNQQLQLPNFNQSESGTTSSAFTFGQPSNGTSTSASFPPFGTNNTGNDSGTNSSFNIPSGNFSFSVGQSAPVNNPFASLSAPSPQDQPKPQSFQGSIFSFSQPPQTSSSPSSFSLTNQPNGTSQSQSGPSKTIFGSTSSSETQNQENSNRLFPSSGAQQQQGVFGQSTATPISNPFAKPSGVNADSGKPKELQQQPPSNIFGHLQQSQSNSNPPSNPSQSSVFNSNPTKSDMSQNAMKPVTNLFGQPSTSSSSQQTPQPNSFFGQQSTFATQPPSSSKSGFSLPTTSNSEQPQSSNNIFNKPTASSATSSTQSNTIFGKPSASGDPRPPETNALGGGQGDSPAAPEWVPKTNLWAEDPNKRQQRSLQDIFGGKKPDTSEQSQLNTDSSMMQTSPDNSPQPKQQPNEARPFAFLNPGGDQTQSSPSKNPNAPLGRSFFDRVSTPNKSDPQANAPSPSVGGLFGRVSNSQPNQISENAVGKPSLSESAGVSEDRSKGSNEPTTKNSIIQQPASQPAKFNPFSTLQVPPSTSTSMQASSPKPVFSFSSTNAGSPQRSTESTQTSSGLFKPLEPQATGSDGLGQSENKMFPSPKFGQTNALDTPSTTPFKLNNADHDAPAEQPAGLAKPFTATKASGSPVRSSDLSRRQDYQGNHPASTNSHAGTGYGQLPSAKSPGLQSAAVEGTQNYFKANSSPSEPSGSEDFNPMVMYIVVPQPPADFTEEEKRQFVTGWRLKVLDEGARQYCERSMTDEQYERVKTFYRFKRQAIFAANGGPMLDLDPKTGEKRKALDISLGEPNKRARSGTGQAQTPSTTPTNLPAKSTALLQTSASPNKRKASLSVGDDDHHANSEKRSRPSPNATNSQHSPSSGSQTSGLFKDILQKDKPTVPSSKTPVPLSKPSNDKVPDTASRATPSAKPKFGTGSSTGGTTSPFKVPNFGTTGGSANFLSQFGQAAKKVEEKDKQKRKADEYDSDEEDETAWERRDAEEQRAKKKKVEEDAAKAKTRFVPGKGFVLDTSQEAAVSDVSDGEGSNSSFSVLDPQHPSHHANSSHNIFGHLSDVDSGIEGSKTGDADDEHDGSVESDDGAAPKSSGQKESSQGLFDRISRDDNGNLIRENSSADSGSLKFGSAGSNTQATNSMTNSSSAPSLAAVLASTTATKSTPKTNVFGLPSAGSVASPFKTASPTNPSTPGSAERGDHTWKPSEPIKFGTNTSTASTSSVQGTGTAEKPSISVVSPSPTKTPLGSLFGTFQPSPAGETPTKPVPAFLSNTSTAPSNTGAGFGFGISLPKPGPNSLAPISSINSRATSPGLTTGESANESNADADEESAEKHEQLDLTAVGPGEEDEEIVFEARAKASKWDDSKQEWITQGLGPFRVMKHRETGNTRMLMRQDPSGRVLVNSNIFAGVTYKAENKSTTRVPIMSAAGKLETWIVKVGKDSDAADLAAKLEDNKQKD